MISNWLERYERDRRWNSLHREPTRVANDKPLYKGTQEQHFKEVCAQVEQGHRWHEEFNREYDIAPWAYDD